MNRAPALLLLLVLVPSCSYIRSLNRVLKEKITVQETIDKKIEVDNTENPALKFKIVDELTQKRVTIKNAVVKDIIESSNIDYQFCVIVEVPSKKGVVECFIYARDFFSIKEDIDTLSLIRKGETRIDADGDFARFFSLLDQTYTKIEIVNSIITIKKEKR